MGYDSEPWFSFGKRNSLLSRCKRSSGIGTVEKLFEGTSISMAKLRRGLRYVAQTAWIQPQKALIGDTLTMKTPLSGLCQGIFLASIWRSIPANENTHELLWVVISNFYLGNRREEPLDRSYGSPAVTENGDRLHVMTNNGKALSCFC